MDLSKKVLGSQLSLSWERTSRGPYGLITKYMKLKFCSKSILLQVLSNAKAQKAQKNQEKNPRGREKSEDHLFAKCICQMQRSSERLKLFIFLVSGNIYISFIFTFHIIKEIVS